MEMKNENSLTLDGIHLFFLSGFAIAQPLFDLLSRRAEFFVIRNTAPKDIILFALILSFLPPTLLALFEGLVGLFGKLPRKVLHYFFVFALVALIALPIAKRTGGVPDAMLIVTAILTSALVTLGYSRVTLIRDPLFLMMASIVVFLFPGLFLFRSSVSRVIFPERHAISDAAAKAGADTPVIFVVFDEFAVTSLMNEKRQIDSTRYPNFKALAEESTWYRNATTMYAYTHRALPTILTGKSQPPDAQLLPFFSDHPENLFTLLSNTHEVHAWETTTQLCPKETCEDSGDEEDDNIFSLCEDVTVIYLHIILPEASTSTLPPVDQNWRSFKAGNVEERPAEFDRNGNRSEQMTLHSWIQTQPWAKWTKENRAARFSRFVQSIQPRGRPGLYFLHTILPHVPYNYLPSGKLYGTDDGRLGQVLEHWKDDESLVRLSQQRYLLQVGFVDRLVGELIAHLKTVGLYDRALIVFTADHGVSFQSDDHRRSITATNYQDIISIPLFIRIPYQEVGRIDDTNVETIDILPTVADILDIPLPWEPEGVSVLDPGRPEREEKHVYSGANEYTYERSLSAKYDSLRRRLEFFGAESRETLFIAGPYRDLIGSKVSEAMVDSDKPYSVEVEGVGFFRNIDLQAAFIPAQIKGSVRSKAGRFPVALAIGLNGTIRAVTESYQQKTQNRFSAVVPEWALRPGFNDLEIFTVDVSPAGKRSLNPTVRRVGEYRLLKQENGEETLITPEGKAIALVDGSPTSRLRCHLERRPTPDVTQARFDGWAIDVENRRTPEEIVIFLNGKILLSVRPDRERPDIVKAFGDDHLLLSGFSVVAPLVFSDHEDSEIRIFAVLKTGIAAEFHYPVGYKWLIQFKLMMEKSEGEFLETSDGKLIPVRPGALRGHIDIFSEKDGQSIIAGWAADVKNMETPSDIVVFVSDEFFHVDYPQLRRQDIVNAFGNEELLWSGFHFAIPQADFPGLDLSEVRIFAISKRGVATELGKAQPPSSPLDNNEE